MGLRLIEGARGVLRLRLHVVSFLALLWCVKRLRVCREAGGFDAVILSCVGVLYLCDLGCGDGR